jgi:capsular exopolysaccharide synthesis family protein
MESLPQHREPDYIMGGPMDAPAKPASPFKFQRFLDCLLRHWWIPSITLVLGVLVAGAIVYWKAPTFASKARMVETLKLRLPEGNLFSEDDQTSVGTQSELLQSTRLREETLQRLKSPTEGNSNNIPIPKDRDGEPVPVGIRVVQSAKSSVFTLEASGPNPAYVEAYLNVLMEVYLEYKTKVRAQVSEFTLASISEQVQKAERDWKEEQNSLLAFQGTNNLAILQEQGTVSGGYLAQLKTRLSDLQIENRLKASVADQQKTASQTNKVAEYKRICDQLESLSKRRRELLDKFTPENSWVVQVDEEVAAAEKLKKQLEAENPGLASTTGDDGLTYAQLASPNSSAGSAEVTERLSAAKELQALQLQRERLSKYLKPKHPKIVKLDGEIERAQKLLETLRRQNQQQLIAYRKELQLRIDNLLGSIMEWETNVVQANTQIAEAERRKLSVQQKKQVVDRLSILLQNVGISRNIDMETLQVLEPASPAKRTYKQEAGIGVAGTLGGLALGAAIVMLITLRDDRFNSAGEVNEQFGDSVVAQVPEVELNGHPGLLISDEGEDRHMYAESYRNLRSALTFLAVDGHRPKTVLVTSALPNEGKSTVSANLARTLALSGSKVLLVDADLRRGALHKLFECQEAPGLAELLQNPGRVTDIIQTNAIPNLSFIAAGARMRNPGDHFLGRTFDQLLEQWRRQFEYVVIDCTPVFAADDATTLAPKADGTLFVVRNRYSGAGQVREALELLCHRQAKVLGVVFNRADSSLRSYHYYKYAEYYSTNGSS